MLFTQFNELTLNIQRYCLDSISYILACVGLAMLNSELLSRRLFSDI